MKTIPLKMVDNCLEYYEFIRILRTHPENTAGFIEQVQITRSQQEAYMEKNGDKFFICLLDDSIPVGYIGVIDNDIRVCTSPQYKQLGIGKFMLRFIKKNYPLARGRILINNVASQKLFSSVGVEYTLI